MKSLNMLTTMLLFYLYNQFNVSKDLKNSVVIM